MLSALYVDDEPALLEVGKLFLERGGAIRVDTISSASEALVKIRSEPYDVIISDYDMPEMNGIMFLKAVREKNLHIPFVMFTGKGREEVVIEALNNGADYYLQKGGSPKAQFAELIHVVERSVEGRRAQETILHLNRILSIISSTNRAIVRIRDRTALFDEACRIAVEEGGFLMAWIGIVNAETHAVIPVAACGYEEGYLQNLSISIDNVPQGMGLTGAAIRECRTIISNDIASDPRMVPFREKAARRGYCSSASIPMCCGGGVIGAMRFYSSEKNFFNDQEIQLLHELVTDICFALELSERKKE
jgi:CheY-like chemotaxis protein